MTAWPAVTAARFVQRPAMTGAKHARDFLMPHQWDGMRAAANLVKLAWVVCLFLATSLGHVTTAGS